MENNDQRKKRVSFAADVETIHMYEEQEQIKQTSSTVSDGDMTAELTLNGSNVKDSFFSNVQGVDELFFNKNVSELLTEKENIVSSSIIEEKDEALINEENIDDKQEKIINTVDIGSLISRKNNIPVDDKVNGSFEGLNLKRKDSFDFRRIGKRNSLNKKGDFLEENCVMDDSSILSNNTFVIKELVNTQNLRTIIPQNDKPKIDISALLIKKGIRFLDNLVISNARKETLSKTKNPVDPDKMLFYKFAFTPRITFFDIFSEELNASMISYGKAIQKYIDEFNVSGSLLEAEDNGTKLRSLKMDSRNRAKIDWYDIRSKKELEFNEQLMKNKNELQIEYNDLLNEYEGILKLKENSKIVYDENREKVDSLNREDIISKSDPININNIKKMIQHHEQLLESYSKEVKELEIKVSNASIHKDTKEEQYKNLKLEIEEIEKSIRGVTITEDHLSETKEEYFNLTSLFGFKIIELNKKNLILEFLKYRIKMELNSNLCIIKISSEYTGDINDLHLFVINIIEDIRDLKDVSMYQGIQSIFQKIFLINEFFMDIKNIKKTNKIDLKMRDNQLHVELKINDIQHFKIIEIEVIVRRNFDIIIKKNGEKYLYNLKKSKGVLFDHVD